mmetsp:Transcript_5548/g.15923  ORF Transcript_5548/g.15923 Transcript_5548/m.15923 type:complete len:109 (-) Transcript_5548:728-1054(-)
MKGAAAVAGEAKGAAADRDGWKEVTPEDCMAQGAVDAAGVVKGGAAVAWVKCGGEAYTGAFGTPAQGDAQHVGCAGGAGDEMNELGLKSNPKPAAPGTASNPKGSKPP